VANAAAFAGFRSARTSEIDDLDEIKVDKYLSKGTSGTVSKAHWRGMDVAVKQFYYVDDSRDRGRLAGGGARGSETLESFENEVFLMKNLDHANLVRFFGAQCKPPSLCIVMELMKGSLADLLYGKMSKGVDQTLTPARQLSVMKDIAAGMAFLHSHSVIHRDLKSANCLFNRQLVVKICDFAFSKFRLAGGASGATSAAFETSVGTPAWMAPEVLRGDEYTLRADVYSYGVITWEVLAKRQPFAELNNFQIINQVGMGQATLPMPETAALLWHRVAAACWDRNPKMRPTFAQLDTVLRAAATQLSSGTGAKLVAPTAGDAAAEAGAGMEAWLAVAAEISAAAPPPQASETAYESGLISELMGEQQDHIQADGDSGHSAASRTTSTAPPMDDDTNGATKDEAH
jgi:serine/threonine protein kinase